MPIPSPHHRHQASLEGAIDFFATTPPFDHQKRQEATRVFHAVINACEPSQSQEPYKQVTLVRLTYEYALSQPSRDHFLQFFFQHTQIPIEASAFELIPIGEYRPLLVAFAETLLENFFLPRKSSFNGHDVSIY
jgi:hypothetical protein